MIKIRMLKDTEKCKVGEVVSCSKENAESTVSQGYAEYINENKLTDLEINSELKTLARLASPIEIERELKKLKEKTDSSLSTLTKQLNYIRKSINKEVVTTVTTDTSDTTVTTVTTRPEPPVTVVTVDTVVTDMIFGDSTLEQIMKHLVVTKQALTFGELALKTEKSEVNIRNTISRNKALFGRIGTKGQICYNFLLQPAIDEIQKRIEKFEYELQKKAEEEEEIRKKLKIEEDYENEVKSFVNNTKFARKGNTILIDFKELNEFNPELSDSLIQEPEKFIDLFKKSFNFEIEVSIINISKSNSINIEELRKEHLDKLVCIEGRVTSFGEVKPVIKKIKFECPSCGGILSVEQNYRTGEIKEPLRCSCGRRGGFNEIERDDENACFLQLEDLQDKTDNPHSQRVKAVIFNDLTNKENVKIFSPGNEIRCVGILKEVPIYKNKKKTVFLNWILQILSAESIEKEVDISNFPEEEVEIIENLSKKIDEEGIEAILPSFAPDVYGYDEIKSAMVLQLCNRRNEKKNGNSRNKSNILLIGDPGIAKSVMCDFSTSVSNGARKAVGGGSSAVGITASVVKEEDSLGGYRVEPGAMILAKDLLFLDELNNLADEDKPKLQEGMNEQTISINKANLHVQMKVTCGILAVANPIHGHFKEDAKESIQEQFNIPSPILNRFDSIFVMRDTVDEKTDEFIAQRMMERHRGKIKAEYERDFLKDFFAYIKSRDEPIISEVMQKEFQKVYHKARKIRNTGVKINPRFLESLTRMAVSYAKLRGDSEVKIKDINMAIRILAKSQYNIEEDLIVEIDRKFAQS